MDTPVPQQNEQIQPHAPRTGFSLKIFFLGFFVILLVFFGIVAIGRNQKFTIEHVQVVGVKTFPSKEILDYTDDFLKQSTLKIAPRSSSLFFSKKTLSRLLQKDFPIIDLAYISFIDPHTIRVTVRERNPEAVWCFAEYKCGFIDRLGILYGESPQFSDGVYTVFSSEEQKDFDQYVGKEIIHPETMYRFDQLFDQLQTEDIIISQVRFLQDGDIAFVIEKLFNHYPHKNTPILGTIHQNDSVFLRDVFTGLDHEVFQKQYLATSKDLEYIDLRFPGKIFYKFKGKEKPLEKVTPQTQESQADLNVQQEVND